MGFRDRLWELCRVQDEITHHNESCTSDSSEFRALKGRRKKLIDELASYVERLEDAHGRNAKEVFEL